jgi:hypothetical protein
MHSMKFGPIPLRWQHLFCAAGLVLLLPVALLVFYATCTPITPPGSRYTIGAVTITLGLLITHWLQRTS